jgi:hypothetical protein
VFDYSRYMDIENHEIALPKNDFRQLKVIVSGIADVKDSPFVELTRKYRDGAEAERIETSALHRRPFRMDRVELWHERSQVASEHDRTADYPVVMSRVEEQPEAKQTVVYVDTRREPLTELMLETGSRNFSRAASVQVPVQRGIQTEWIDIAHGPISSLSFGGYHRESLALAFPEHREPKYRIVIHNEDNPPLKVTGVKAQGNAYRVIFLAAATDAYRLGYGSDDAQQPKYDAAAVLAPLRAEGNRPVDVRLGKETPLAAATMRPAFTLRDIFGNSFVIGTVIGLLVVLLAAALFGAARRINKLPPGQ